MQSPRIFVSHSHRDNDWCQGFVEALQAEGYDAWYDAKGLDGGSQWVLTIQRELQEREVFMIVLTPDAWASEWVQEELQLALTKRRRIIPVLLKQTSVEGFLLNRQWIDVVGMDYASAARRVGGSLGVPSALSASSPELQPSPQTPTPKVSEPEKPFAQAAAGLPPAVPAAPTTARAETSLPPNTAPAKALSQEAPPAQPPVAPPSRPLPAPPSIYPPASRAHTLPLATRASGAGRRTAIGAGVSMLLVVSIIAGILLTMHNRSGGTTSNQPQLVRGGSIVDALFEEPDSLLPELTGETYSYLVDAAIWDPLLYGDNHGIAQPGILTQVPSVSNGGISSDLKTYTLKLRPSLKWSDGTALTSADVKLAADLFSKSDSKGNSLYGDQDGWVDTEIASVTAPDPQTVVVTLNTPDITFVLVQLVDAGTFTPLPVSEFQGYLTHPQDLRPSQYNLQPDITNGPFKIKERVKGDHITLVKNPYYRLGPDKPYLDQITFQIVPDSNTILTDLQAGTIQSAYFADFTKYDAYSALSGYKIYSAAGAGFENIIFNFKNPILADKAVRQALTMSLDTNQINTKLYRGLGVATCDDGIGTFAHDPSTLQPGGKSCYKFDVNGSKQLLASDGWSQPDSNGTLTYHGTSSSIAQGTKLELKYSTTANRPTRQETEAIAIQSWAAIGVKIDEIDYPAATFFGTLILNNPNPYSSPGVTRWDIAEFLNGGSYDPDDHLSWDCNATLANSGFNYGYYCNPQVDQLEAQQVLQGDQTQRANTFHQIYKLMLADPPNMFYFSPPALSLGSTKLHNYNPSDFGPSETWNVQTWWLAH